MDGVCVYLNANPDLQPTLDIIEAAGGQVISPKKQIGFAFNGIRSRTLALDHEFLFIHASVPIHFPAPDHNSC
jgi:hypothetical protein